MAIPVIIMALIGAIILAVVVFGMTDAWEIIILAGLATIMMGLYTGTI